MNELSGDEDDDAYWKHSVRKVNNIFNEEREKIKVWKIFFE